MIAEERPDKQQFNSRVARQTYQPQPLREQAPLASELDELKVNAAALYVGSHGDSAPYQVDLADGLDLTEVGILAVLNNPGLKAQRTRLQVAGAQAFAAGLLPDPQISAGLDKPIGNSAGLVNAWSLGLSYDIIPLITRASRVDAAAFSYNIVDAWSIHPERDCQSVRAQVEWL